jgi:hypothetical protein
MKAILKLLKVKKDILYTNDFEKITTENDYRIALSKNATNKLEMPEYYQVFSDRHGFVSNLSIVDLLFNEGPNSINNL